MTGIADKLRKATAKPKVEKIGTKVLIIDGVEVTGEVYGEKESLRAGQTMRVKGETRMSLKELVQDPKEEKKKNLIKIFRKK